MQITIFLYMALLFLLSAAFSAHAFQPARNQPYYSDGEAVVTIKNNLPCFSYPRDKEVVSKEKKGIPYGLHSIGLIANARRPQDFKGRWELQHDDGLRHQLDRPEACIEYGSLPSHMNALVPTELLQLNVPYEISMSLYTSKGHNRIYSSFFCLVRNEDNELVITGAVYDKDARVLYSRCLKPGEKPPKKSTFLQRLFGE
jgi:hypothetical protein